MSNVKDYLCLSVILFIGAALRLFLICYGIWQDHNFDLQYTDIDYKVFSDAAIHVSEVRKKKKKLR